MSCCLDKYIKLAGTSEGDEFLFRALQLKGGVHCLSSNNKPLSYSRVRELFKFSLDSIGVDKDKFGLHSLRSGGATSAANNSVPDRLFKIHGRWKSENVKDGYVQVTVKDKLSVSSNLGI